MEQESKAPEEVTAEQFQVQRALLGIDAESFWKSKVGRYIQDRIDVELGQLHEDLYQCDPNDIAKATQIRSEISVRRLLGKFVDEAIQSGLQAERELEQENTPMY